MDKSTRAKLRWKMLAECLLRKRYPLLDCKVSMREFCTFGILDFQPSSVDVEDQASIDNWMIASIPCLDFRPNLEICVPTPNFDRPTLVGYNNTGNVCIWPSEEVAAYWLVKNAELFKNSRIVELGCGCTGLAGLCLAATGLPAEVWLTDGNASCVENITRILKRNTGLRSQQPAGSRTQVRCQVLEWGPAVSESLRHRFDYVIAADCFFFDESQHPLLQSILALLRPGGSCYFWAPSRGASLENFATLLQQSDRVDAVVIADDYDDVITKLNQQNQSTMSAIYAQDVHYPKMLMASVNNAVLSAGC